MKTIKLILLAFITLMSVPTFAQSNEEIELQNPGFTDKSASRPKIAGWVCDLGPSSHSFTILDSEEYESGSYVCAWIGQTSYLPIKLYQDVNVTKAGVYTFKCKGFALNESHKNFNDQMMHVEGNDTTYTSGVFLTCGVVKKESKLEIFTASTSPVEFEVKYVKETEGEEVLRVALDGSGNKGCNTFGMSDCHLVYEDLTAGIQNSNAEEETEGALSDLMGRPTTVPMKNTIYIKNGQKIRF